MDAVVAKPKSPAVRRDPIAAARGWLDVHPRVALATVISTWGASPVPVGGQLAVAPDDLFEGSVSGGCVEAEVIFAGGEAIASGRPALLEFGVKNETAWRAGLPCGGRLEVLVETLDRGAGADYLDRLLTARGERAPLVVRTRLGDGAREIFDGPTASGDVDECMRTGRSRIVEDPEGRAFLNAVMPPVHIVIVGATHLGQVLSDLATRIGWTVVVVDPRTAFASDERFGCIPRSTEWPAASLKEMRLDRRTAVVALSHVAQIDDEALVAALASQCFYVGALGSRRSHAARLERLATVGVGESDAARVRAPVGLAIGAQGPEEIAVSILAEIVRDLRAL